jgi:hypothetical protein
MIIALSGIAGISRIINFFWLFGVLTIGANQNFFDERESPLLTSLYLYLWGRGYKKIHWVGCNCSPIKTLSLVFTNYKIWFYRSNTLSMGVILSPFYCNLGVCRPLHGLAESSRSYTLCLYLRQRWAQVSKTWIFFLEPDVEVVFFVGKFSFSYIIKIKLVLIFST